MSARLFRTGLLARLALWVFLFAAFASPAAAAKTTLCGKAPSHAGLHIVVSSYADYVSRLKQDLLTIDVAPDGSFEGSVDIDEVTYAFLELSVYTASIYLEPGGRYEVELPPLRFRDDADRFNPFYRPQEVRLHVLSPATGLNDAIGRFDAFFFAAYAQAAPRLVRSGAARVADQVIARCDSVAQLLKCGSEYFERHVEYRCAQVYASARMDAPRRVMAHCFAGKPVLYNLPAYWQALQTAEPNLLSDARMPAVRRTIRKELAHSAPSVQAISAAAAADTLWADTELREAVIIRSIFQDFYAGRISEGRADTLLISAAKVCPHKRNRLMAANIYAKKNKLRDGLKAPAFNLLDYNDKEVTVDSYRGRFLYLCFMHSDNYECLKAMPALDNLARLHRADLDVLCVFTDERDLGDIIKRKKYAWKGVSFVTDQKIIFEYEVKALPTYFLIAPDGCIAMTQAPGPTENVGPAIAKAIRDYNVAQKRGRPEIPRTIYDIANENR